MLLSIANKLSKYKNKFSRISYKKMRKYSLAIKRIEKMHVDTDEGRE